MLEKLENFLLFFINPYLRNTKEDKLLSLAIATIYFLSVSFLIFFGTLFFLIKYYAGTIAASISLFFTILAIFILKTKPDRKLSALFGLLGNYIGFLIFITTSGGIFSPTAPWLSTLPVFAFLFRNKKSGIWWTIIVSLTYITLFLLNLYDIHLPKLMPESSLIYDEFFSTIGVVFFIVLMIGTYEAIMNEKNLQLRNFLEKLQQQKQELLMQKEELQAQKEFIELSERKIRTILELLPDAVMIIDADGKVTHWNKALEKMTGVKAEDIIGKGNYEYAIPFYGQRRPILIDLAKAPTDFLKKNYQNIKISDDGVLKAEAYVPNLQGKKRYLIGISTALYDEKGNYTGAIEVIHDITEIKQAQEELKLKNQEILKQKNAIAETEKRLRKILELLPDAVLIIDAQGRVTHWNKSLERMTGVKAQEIIGKGNYEYALPFYGHRRKLLIDLVREPDDFLEKNYKNIKISDGVLKAETYVPFLKGEKRYVLAIATALYDDQGNYTGAIEVIHDITDIKKAEEELLAKNEEILQQNEEIMAQRDAIAETEKRLRKILELLPDAVLIINADGIVTHWNKAIEKMTGVKAEDIIGKGNYEYALPFYGKRRPILIDLAKAPTDFLKENYQNIKISDDGVLKAETYVPNLRGQERYVIAIATALYDEKGNYVGGIEVIHDVTELKQTQMELKEKMELLRKSEQRIRKIIDFLPNALFIVDKKGVITHWNKTIEALTGYKAEQMIGKGNREYAIPFFKERRKMLVDYTKYTLDYIKKNFPHIKIRGKNLESDAEVVINNEKKYLIGSATALYDEKNQYDGAIEIIIDITERRKEKLKLKYLSLVASNTDNAVIIMDKNGNIEWVNKAFEKIYGYDLEQLKKLRGGNIKDAWNVENIQEILNTIFGQKKSITIQTEDKDKNGKTIYTQTTITPILNEDGQISNIVAISTDITEIVNYEKELTQKNKEILKQKEQLESSENRIRKILESIPDAAFVIDKDGKIVYWNKAIEEMTGVKAEDMIGKGNYEYAIPFYGERREILIDLVDKPREYIEKNYTSVHLEKGFLKAENYVPNVRGEERYLIGVAAAIYDSKGNYAGAIEIIHDITPLKKAKEEIEKSQKEITDSIRYAKHIQEAILPNKNFLKQIFKEYFILYLPKQIVSGDFYWLRKINDKLIIVAADCTGHGVPGALISMLGFSFLNDITNELKDNLKPNLILDNLREKIKNSLSKKNGAYTYKDGMDLALAIIDMNTLILEFAGAYNPLIIIRQKNGEKELIQLKPDRQPIGVYIVEKPFSSKKIQLMKNDMIYMFSDGYPDQLGDNNKGKFSMRRFKNLLSQISHLPVEEQKQILITTFEQWKGNAKQLDDILILGFRI